MTDAEKKPDDKSATKKAVKPLRPLTFNKSAAPEADLNKIAWENAAKLKRKQHAEDNAELMFKAIREKYPMEEIHALLTGNIDYNARDDRGLTFMHAAVAEKNLNALAVLINAGLDMHAKIEGITPLMLGLVGYNLQDCAVMLAKADPDLSQHTIEGVTPVHLAAEKYDCDRVLEVLLERGMDPAAKDSDGRPPLYYALKSKRESAFLLCNAGGCLPADRALLDDAIVNREKTYGFDYDWNLLLDYAAKKDPAELRASLGVKGPQKPRELNEAEAAFFKDVRGGGSSFRFEKCYSDHTGLDYRDFDGMTPLMRGVASKTGSDMWAIKDLRWGSDEKAVDDAGRTLLHYLVRHTDSPASTIFENMGWRADADKQDNFGRTALMATMQGGNFIGALMGAGANPFIRDNLGLAAMDYAKLYKSDYCAERLAEEMAKHGWDEKEPGFTPYKHRRNRGYGY